jgi:hypothetical protein
MAPNWLNSPRFLLCPSAPDLPTSLALEQAASLTPPEEVALGDEGGGVHSHQTMGLGSLVALGSSIFMSDSSNGGKEGTL